MKKPDSYIEFLFSGYSPSGKTKIWIVRNVNSDVQIGIVRWAGNWRKYVYEQEGSIYYDWNCLRDIANFIELATVDHRSKK